MVSNTWTGILLPTIDSRVFALLIIFELSGSRIFSNNSEVMQIFLAI